MIPTASSLTAAAILTAASALSHDALASTSKQHAQHTRLLPKRQSEETIDASLCSCSPQSYTFQLLLDNDCSSSTLSRDIQNGISNANCQISSALTNRKRKNRRQLQQQQRRDEDDEPYFSRLQSQLRSTLPTFANPNNDRQIDNNITAATTSTPAYISSILFIEFDASGSLSIINEDASYLFPLDPANNLTTSTVITYPSITQSLNASLALEEQLDHVPGGAGLFMFGNDDNGEAILRSRVVWEFTGDCDVVPVLEDETLGWIKFEETTPAKREFCPALPSSSPTIPSGTPAPSTKSPTSLSPTTATPTISPSAKPTTANPTSEPSNEPTTSQPSLEPTNEPTTGQPSSEPTNEPTTGQPSSEPTNVPTSATPSEKPIVVVTTLAPVVMPTKVTKAPSPVVTKAPTTPDSKSTKAPVVTPFTKTPSRPPTTESPSALYGKSSKKSKLFKSSKSSKAKGTASKSSKNAKLFKEGQPKIYESKKIEGKASSSKAGEKQDYIMDAKGAKFPDAKGFKVTAITVTSGKSTKNGKSGNVVGKATKKKAEKRFRLFHEDNTTTSTTQDELSHKSREK